MGEFQSLNVQSLSTQARLNAASANGTSQSSKYRNLGLIVAPNNLDEMFGSESVCSPKSLGHEPTLLAQFEAHMHTPIQFQNHMSPQASVQMQLQAHQQQAAMEAQLKGSFLNSPKKSLSSSPFSLGPLSRMSPLKVMDIEKQQQQEYKEASQRSSFGQHDKLNHNHNYSHTSRELVESGLLWSDWGSPTGKPEWGFPGDDLSKLRRSASSGLRASDEPDLSWVQKLVKEGPLDVDTISSANGIIRLEADNDDHNTTIGLERENADMPRGSWIDKLHLDHIVA